MNITFEGRVAIVTGAGGGLGRAHALALGSRGAGVLVNDTDAAAAGAVAEEIRAAGGRARAVVADVTDLEQVQAMVAVAVADWGRVDILVNNAGILRDRTFAKLEPRDFQAVLDVHLMGAVNTSRTVWPFMRDQRYGRIVMTSSASGLFGNFGQSSYAAAKAALVGLMNALHLEGASHGIHVNALAPAAATQMTRGLVDAADHDLLDPAAVTPGVLFLVSEQAPSRTILSAGAGGFAVVRIVETRGVHLPPAERTPEGIAARFDQIASMARLDDHAGAFLQFDKFLGMAREHAADAPVAAE